MVGGLTHQRVDEVGTTESTSDERMDHTAVWRFDFDVLAHVREDVGVPLRDQCQLTEIAVGGEVFEGVQGFSKQSEGLILVVLVAGGSEFSTVMNTFLECASDECFGCIPSGALYSRSVTGEGI